MSSQGVELVQVHYDIKSDDLSKKALTFVEDPTATGRGREGFRPWAKVWQSATLLMRFVETHFKDNPHGFRRGLELGAGTGAVGMMLSECGLDEVVITDLEEALPFMALNVEKNYERKEFESPPAYNGQPGMDFVNSCGTKIRLRSLCWGEQEQADALQPPFDVVLASDVVYFPELFDILIDTLNAVCSLETVLYIAYKKRSIVKEEGFFYKMGRYFEFEEITQDMIDKDFRDDPDYLLLKCSKRQTPLDGPSDQYWLMQLGKMEV
eukprot:Colp12_sorted_trinity150504_noHs@9416